MFSNPRGHSSPDWSKRYREHFLRTFLLAACFLATDLAEPALTQWPTLTLRWLFLCAALVSAALVGHAASMNKVFPKPVQPEPKKWIEL